MVLSMRTAGLAWILAFSAGVQAQTFAGDVPMDEYLSLLDRLMPAARAGADAYRAAFSSRCGRQMKTMELRKAMAEGDGDPILMGMIRASHYRDQATLESLALQVQCPGRKASR